MRPSLSLLRTLPPLITLAWALAGCGTQMVNPVTGQTERSVMSEADEVAEGKKGHEAVVKQYGLYPDAKVQAYVNDVGQKLAAKSHRAHLAWHFTVLDSPEINAFALPGGYVYVTRGIMAYMDSEADLAGVIGHEIGHVTARHGAQRATRQQTAGLGVLAASILGAVLEGQGMRGAGQMASQVSQNVAAGYIASYGREQELQADGLGAEYLARSQYNPANMVDVITVLESQERFAADQARAEGRTPSQEPNWLASHPSNQRRLQDIKALAAKYQGQYGDDGRARYLQAIGGLAFGDSQAQGLVRGQHFYHGPLNFALTAPAGWKIINSDEALAVVSPDSTAGLVVRPVPSQAGNTPEDVIRNVVKPTQGQIQNTTINGLGAARFNGQRRNAQGQVQAVQATVINGPGGHRYLLVPSGRDAAALQRARGGLQEAESSFRTMTAADKAAAKPWVLRTVPHPRGGFAELARQSPLGTAAESQLRLLNGFYGGGEPKTGQPVKVVANSP